MKGEPRSSVYGDQGTRALATGAKIVVRESYRLADWSNANVGGSNTG